MRYYLKLFILSLKSKIDTDLRQDYGILSVIVSSLCNLILFASKLSVAIISGSVAMVADAFNNLSDLNSQIISLISFKVSSKPADKNHPFGHARAEYLATTLVSVLILLMGVSLLRSAYTSLKGETTADISLITFLVLIISILIKLGMYFYNRKLALALKSELLMATAKDSLNDVIATSAVLFSAILTLFSRINLDPYAAALVAIFIIKTGIQILLDMLNRLMGGSFESELFQSIIRKVNSYSEILSSHDLLIHEYGPGNVYATIHVAMDANMRLLDIHLIVDTIERAVHEETGVKLLIHVDPDRAMTSEEQRIVRLIQNTIHSIDLRLHIHDFQFLGHRNGIKQSVSYDVVIPDSFQMSDEELEQVITAKINEQGLNIRMFIDFDRAYKRYNKEH